MGKSSTKKSEEENAKTVLEKQISNEGLAANREAGDRPRDHSDPA